MGLLGKIIAAKATAAIVGKLNRGARGASAPRQEYIPAGQAGLPARAGGNAIVGRATDFYRQNPKLVAGLGLALAALAMQQLGRRR